MRDECVLACAGCDCVIDSSRGWWSGAGWRAEPRAQVLPSIAVCHGRRQSRVLSQPLTLHRNYQISYNITSQYITSSTVSLSEAMAAAAVQRLHTYYNQVRHYFNSSDGKFSIWQGSYQITLMLQSIVIILPNSFVVKPVVNYFFTICYTSFGLPGFCCYCYCNYSY